jgi:hypothetical protein
VDFRKAAFRKIVASRKNPCLKFPAQMVDDRKVELTGALIDRPQSEDSD